MTRVHALCVLLLLDLISGICVGFDVCHNLIQVEHDFDKNKKVTACRYDVLKLDPSGVMIRETVSTPVNTTLCHELRTADTCSADGELVTCHHVPEWERHPHGTFIPPTGCTFSQNLQCQLETICPTEVEQSGTIAVSKTTEKTMTTTETHRRQFVKTIENPVKVEATTAENKETTTEQEEITQHIFIHVQKYVTEKPHSGATVISVNSLVTILSVVMNILFLTMKL